MRVAEDMGVLAIARGYATAREVRDARREQVRRGCEGRSASLAEILVEAGVLDRDQLRGLLESRRVRREPEHRDHGIARFGDIAAAKRYVTADDVAAALAQQRVEDAAGSSHRLVGEIMLESGCLSPWELEDVVATLADLASGSCVTGDTPSEAIPVGADRFDGDCLSGRRDPCALARDVMAQVPTTTDTALLGDVLDAAFEVEAEVVLVMGCGMVRGLVPVWDVCQLDRRTRVRDVLRSTFTAVSGALPIIETTRILRERDLPCVVVIWEGRCAGVVTRRELRRSGVLPSELDDDAVPFEELGVGD
jgi:hypothetical protein